MSMIDQNLERVGGGGKRERVRERVRERYIYVFAVLFI